MMNNTELENQEIKQIEQNQGSDNLKEDWVDCSLGEVFETVTGNTPSKKDKDNYGSEIPFIKPPQINNNFLKTSAEFLSTKGKIKARILPINSVLVTCIGNLGRIGINKAEVAFNQQINAIKPISGIEPKYTFYQAQSVSFRNQLEKLSTSTTVALVNKTSFNSVKFKIAPLPTQKAIVKKIEELFSSLDSGIADLKKAQDQLDIYRQAVLKKAFEGELTKEWREKQIKNYELGITNEKLPSADELLEQIKEERQKHYDQQLATWKEAVKVWEGNGKVERKPTKPRALKFVDEFTKLELSELDKLPTEWKLVKLGNVFQVFVGSTPSRSKIEYWQNGNINWVSSGEVAFKSIYQTKEKITAKGLNNASTFLHPKGTVMLAMIGEGKTRGQAAILEIEACHNQNTAAIRVSEIGFEPKYLFHYLFLKYERNRRVGSGNNQKALNQGRIMNFDFPLCSIQEQHQIVQEIESRLSVCDTVEKDIADSLEKAQALRQSILKKAFEGKLLSEEEIAACKAHPDYEPASVLLEKIKNGE